MITVTYILQQFYGAMIGVGTYYAKYVLADENMFGTFAWFINIPLIIALIFTPTIVQKWNGMYKLNKYSYMVATVGRLLVAVAGYMGNIPLMLAFTALAALGQGPWQGDMNAVIASCSEYSWLTKHKHVDGIMYSCTSLGVKIGGGLGTAIVGLLLDFSGFKGTLTVQPDSAINRFGVLLITAMPGLLTIGIKIKSYCHAKMNFLTLLIIPMSMRTTHRSNMKRCFAICTRYLPSTKIFLWTTILANCHSEVLPKSILSPKPQSNGD